MKARAYLKLFRIDHGVMYGFGVLVGIFIAAKNLPLEEMLFGFLTAVFLQSSTFALNDYFDYEVDLANKRFDRPLVTGEISRREALLSGIFLFPMGLVFSYLISPLAFVFALLISLLGVLYDLKLKEFGLIGNVYIATTMAAPFLFGGIIMENLNEAIILLSALAFISGLGREIMKGIEDVEGDKIRNAKTVAILYGEKFAAKIAALLFMLAVSLSFLALIFPEFRDIKYLIPVLACDAILLFSAFKLLKGVKREEIYSLRKRTMSAMALGMLAFLLGVI